MTNEHGDVRVFADTDVACASLEAVDVDGDEYEAFDLSGHPIDLVTEGERVFMRMRPDQMARPEYVDSLLRDAACKIDTKQLQIADVNTATISELADALILAHDRLNTPLFGKFAIKVREVFSRGTKRNR